MKSVFLRLAALVLLIVLLTGCAPKAPDQSINGINIRQYTLVYDNNQPEYCKRAAEYIRDEILARTGVELTIADTSGSYAHEILIGETDRALSHAANLKSNTIEFFIAADDQNIALQANAFVIAAAAYYFVETYIPGNAFQSAIDKAQPIIAQPITEDPTHYIFLIGDGMGDNHIQLLKDHTGETFYGLYLPYAGKLHTDCLTGTTDSAAAATAMACGYKTNSGYIGMDAEGIERQSLTELAGSLGMKTAIMTTDNRNGATPSGFTAHAMDRDDTEDILADQLLLVNNYGTEFQYNLNSAYNLEGDIFDVLDTVNIADQFFLMYEEAHIDKYSHKNNVEDTVACMLRFNQAIGIFMEYAFYHPDTFVIITADHETGGLLPNDNNQLVFTQESHSSIDVSIFGYGKGAEIFQNCQMENNQVAKIIANMWGIEDFGQ